MTRILLALALFTGWVLAAQAEEGTPWQGRWDTKYGDLRLLQHRNIVVGDYDRFGLIVGIAEDGALRGTFTPQYSRNTSDLRPCRSGVGREGGAMLVRNHGSAMIHVEGVGGPFDAARG
jgi:hypothetical protein